MFRMPFTMLLLASVAAASGSAGEDPKSAPPLAVELEGLAPEARIAYLRHLVSSGREDSEVRFQLGVAFQDRGEADSALRHYRRSLDLDPGLSKAYVNMGVLWDGLRRPLEAIAMFEKAIEIRPDDPLARSYAASALLGLGRHEEAWKHLDRALAIDSRNPEPHHYLAVFFWECGMFREALAEWERVIELVPESPLARQAEANIALAERLLAGTGVGGEPVPEGGR